MFCTKKLIHSKGNIIVEEQTKVQINLKGNPELTHFRNLLKGGE